MIVEALRRDHGVAFTRNAIIGKAHRLGLVKKGAPSGPPRASAGRKAVSRPPAPPPKPQSEAPKASPLEFTPRVVDARPGHLTFQELNDKICKYECSGQDDVHLFTFCGRPSQGGPYCPAHARICFLSPLARKRKAAA